MKRISKKILVLTYIIVFTGNLIIPIFDIPGSNSSKVSACVEEKVTICHATESPTNPYVTIHTSSNAINGHFENEGTPKAGHEEDILLQGHVECPQPPPVCTDNDQDTYAIEGGDCGPIDCDDSNPNVHPGAEEVCNQIDDDCDGQIDEDNVCPPQCIVEGGSGAVVPGGPQCCQGLTQIGCDQPDQSGECSQECVGAFFCTYCGNGICGLGENKCNCPEDCHEEPVCGNGILETGEQCDDANTQNGDGCSANCTFEQPYCELQLTKTDNVDPVEPGENLVYHLTLKNTGTANCTGGGVRLKDVFDQNTTYVSSSKTPEEITTTYVKWNFGTLTPGEEENVDLTMQVLEDVQCGTILENKAKYWSDQTGWGEFVIETTTVQCPSPEYVNIYAHKIVCESETDLPNWGDGGPDITATTAQAFVNSNQSCHLASEWDFEWAQAGIPNPGDNIIGPAGSGWTTFGPTDSNGLASVNINSVSGDRLWLREVMKEGYFPFSGDTTAPRDNVSAEMYCHQDVLNYDNYDYVLNPQLGQAYYCVAFNVLATTTEPTSTLIVIDHVIGGTATSGAFTVSVTGTNPLPASFPGEEAPGTTVIIEPGVYNVSQSTLLNYTTSFSADCSSTIAAGETKTCTITNVYQEQPPSTSTLIVIDHVVGGTATSGNFTVYVSGNSPSTTSFPGEESPGTAVTINPGAYNATQSTLSNYTTSYSENCSSTILAGEIKTCTITNTYQCVPTKPCSELGCGKTDSCGNYCGNCGGGGGSYCGDGVVNSGEECDRNAGVSEGYTCNTSCKLEKKFCKMDINVMMVLDVSGSMGYNTPTRLSQAKIAANSFLDNLRSGDQSGLVSFSWTAALNKKLSNDHASTKLAVNGLTASGATNIGDAIDKANKELTSTVDSLSTAKIQILLTDGRANQPNGNGFEENPLDLALALDKSLEAAENGIMIFTIGLGPDVNANMLRNIAQNTGGKYYFAPTSNDLTGVFNQIASETCKSTSTAYESPAITVFNAGIRSVSNTSVVVSWYTNIPATSRVVYGEQKISTPGIAPNYGYAFTTPEQDLTNKVIFHSVTISGLIPNKTYYWRPISRGSPEVWGEELSFTTVTETSTVEGTNQEGTSTIETVQEETGEISPEFNERLNQEEGIVVENSQENQGFLAFLSGGVASIFDALKTLFTHKLFICALLTIIIIALVILLFKKRKREKEETKLVTTLEQ